MLDHAAVSRRPRPPPVRRPVAGADAAPVRPRATSSSTRPGHLLFDRGQPAQRFFIVLDGQVNLVLYSKAGEEKIVDILGPGNSFAEAVMFMEAPDTRCRPWRRCGPGRALLEPRVPGDPAREPGDLPAHARPPEPAPAHAHPRDRVPHARERDAPAGAADRGPPAAGRSPGPTEITLQESRQELASRLSMKPETLSRILRHLADAGAIVVHGRVLQVPDRETTSRDAGRRALKAVRADAAIDRGQGARGLPATSVGNRAGGAVQPSPDRSNHGSHP